MRAIPRSLRKKINDEWKKECIFCGRNDVELHHAFIYSGRQVNELWALVYLCKSHHKLAHGSSEFKRLLQNICLNNASDDELSDYSKTFKKIIEGEER